MLEKKVMEKGNTGAKAKEMGCECLVSNISGPYFGFVFGFK